MIRSRIRTFLIKNVLLGSLIWALLGIPRGYLTAQNYPIYWGQIKKEALLEADYKWEPGAKAVVLCDFGAWYPHDWEKGLARLERHVRIKILKPEALNLAQLSLAYQKDEQITKLKAQTLNLDNGRKKTTKLNLSQLPAESLDAQTQQKSFRFREVKVGSVIEYKYTLITPRFETLKPWYFQGEIPTQWSEVWTVGFFPNRFMGISNRGEIKALSRGRWRLKYVPAIPSEPLQPNPRDYYLGLRFQLVPPDWVPNAEDKWRELADLYHYRTEPEEDPKTWQALHGLAISLTRDALTEAEKAARIHRHLSQYMEWDGSWRTWVERPLGEVYRSRQGNGTEINMLYVTLLEMAGITVSRLFVSTRQHGKLPRFPHPDMFDHMLCLATLEGKHELLDATNPLRPYDLPPRAALNEVGFELQDSTWINRKLSVPGSVAISLCRARLDESAKLSGSLEIELRGYRAVDAREALAAGSDSAWASNLLREKMPGARWVNWVLLDVEEAEFPLRLKGEFVRENALTATESGWKLTPVPSVKAMPNPFPPGVRILPIDWGFPFREDVTLILDLGPQYLVDMEPTKMRLRFPGGQWTFELQASHAGRIYSFTRRLMVDEPVLMPEEYPGALDFYQRIQQAIPDELSLQASDHKK